MMGPAQFALIALFPAALGTAPVGARAMAMPLCTGNGQVRLVEVPLEQPGKAPEQCRDKACHGGIQRKQVLKHPGSRR